MLTLVNYMKWSIICLLLGLSVGEDNDIFSGAAASFFSSESSSGGDTDLAHPESASPVVLPSRIEVIKNKNTELSFQMIYDDADVFAGVIHYDRPGSEDGVVQYGGIPKWNCPVCKGSDSVDVTGERIGTYLATVQGSPKLGTCIISPNGYIPEMSPTNKNNPRQEDIMEMGLQICKNKKLFGYIIRDNIALDVSGSVHQNIIDVFLTPRTKLETSGLVPYFFVKAELARRGTGRKMYRIMDAFFKSIRGGWTSRMKNEKNFLSFTENEITMRVVSHVRTLCNLRNSVRVPAYCSDTDHFLTMMGFAAEEEDLKSRLIVDGLQLGLAVKALLEVTAIQRIGPSSVEWDATKYQRSALLKPIPVGGSWVSFYKRLAKEVQERDEVMNRRIEQVKPFKELLASICEAVEQMIIEIINRIAIEEHLPIRLDQFPLRDMFRLEEEGVKKNEYGSVEKAFFSLKDYRNTVDEVFENDISPKTEASESNPATQPI